MGALAQFKQKYDVKITAHQLDAPAIESGRWFSTKFYGINYQPCPADIRPQEAEHDLHFGKHELKTLHIPSYTRDSIAVYVDVAGKRVLFGQDIHGRYELAWGGDPSQTVVSLQKLIDLEADILLQQRIAGRR